MLLQLFNGGVFPFFFLSPGLYTVELFVIISILIRRRARRSKFTIRYIAAAAASIAYSLFMPSIPIDGIAGVVIDYTVKFFFVVLLMYFCYKISFPSLMFVSTLGFCAQNIADNVNNAVLYRDYGFGLEVHRILSPIIFLLSYALIFFLVSKYFGWKVGNGREIYITLSPMQTIIFVVLTLFFANFLNMFLLMAITDRDFSLMKCFVMIACNILIIFSQINALMRDRVASEIKKVNDMWKKDRQAYEISKEKLNALNIQLHDIKHLFKHADREGLDGERNYISELLDDYDNFISSGNEALDVVINEYINICRKQKIELTVMANGESIRFMNSVDIYTLFGNILTNAIESVSALEEGKKIISVQVFEKDRYVIIKADNCYKGNINFKNGLPVTTKADENYHGYGTKSIALLTNNYKGVYSFSVADDIFSLEISIPLPKKPKKH